jgi:hypothetical protein
MPISIIGPMKMRKFAMKRKNTKMTWIHNDGVLSTWLIPFRMLVAAPGHVASGLFFSTRKIQTMVMMLVRKIATRK